jgi:RNA polymerase sigma-70 factor (ECF subfamily)
MAPAAERPPVDYGTLFGAHRSFLWSLLYRMTGNAADAEDIVQETFVRAMARPPARTDQDWRPWLVKVALNLGRDLLRKRRRRGYPGVWLPTPVETEEPPSYDPVDTKGDPSVRYELLETVSFAFLLALEALTPAQRAVFLLRAVLDYSVREAARAVSMSEANVKTTHARARRAMGAYDRNRRAPTSDLRTRTAAALSRFLEGLARGDVSALESLLAADVRAFADAGGEFPASPEPIRGREKVARLYLGLGRRLSSAANVRIALVNGLPAVLVEQEEVPTGWPRRAVLQCELGVDSKISRIYTVVATSKVRSLFRPW